MQRPAETTGPRESGVTIRNFESLGWDQGTIGIVSIDQTYGGFWDAAVPPYATPPGIYPRDNLLNLQFFTNVADACDWLFPVSRVLSAKNSSEVRGLVLFDASGKSNGSGTTVPIVT